MASYHAPRGNYAVTDPQFLAAGVDNPPLHALRDGVDGGNGLYAYGPSGTFPNGTWQSEGYWVDVVFDTDSGPDTTAPTVTGRLPAPDAQGVAPASNVSVSFSEAMEPASITTTTFQLRDPGGQLVPAAVSYDSGEPHGDAGPAERARRLDALHGHGQGRDRRRDRPGRQPARRPTRAGRSRPRRRRGRGRTTGRAARCW